MRSPRAYLRDEPRVCLHVSEQEWNQLKTELKALADPDSETWFAENRVLFPRKKADSLQDSISTGWNVLTNVELWVAFHALLGNDGGESLRERFQEATREIERMDADAKKLSNRGPNWEEERQRALERDNYECIRCGDEEKLHVHHRVEFRRHNTAEGANRLENLETLCPSCHQRAEAEEPV